MANYEEWEAVKICLSRSCGWLGEDSARQERQLQTMKNGRQARDASLAPSVSPFISRSPSEHRTSSPMHREGHLL